jgi:hypothetical protein
MSSIFSCSKSKRENDSINVMHSSFNDFLNTGDRNNIKKLKISQSNLQLRLMNTKDADEIGNIKKKIKSTEYLIKSMESLAMKSRGRGFL